MLIKIIAIGNKLPSWVNTAFNDYQKRFSKSIKVELIEIAMPKRVKTQSIQILKDKEESLIQEHIEKNSFTVALDVLGKSISTETLAINLKSWEENYKLINFIIGGPDGFNERLLKNANYTLSLSQLTMPHTLARIMLIEQLYRAWTINKNHPYHRSG